MALRRRGSAMVEMAVILPVVAMVLFATVELGVVFQRWQLLGGAARAGARAATAYRGSSCDTATVTSEARERVRAYLDGFGVDLEDDDIVVNGACAGPDTPGSVEVRFVYGFQVLSGLSSMDPTIDLVGRAVMRNEGSASSPGGGGSGGSGGSGGGGGGGGGDDDDD